MSASPIPEGPLQPGSGGRPLHDAGEAPALRRTLSLPLLTLYGLGTIIGAGIYVLTGKVVGIAGMYAPLAFLVAAVAAFFTALTYAELGARYPKSAGEPLYVAHGFGMRQLSIVVGLMIVASGIISSATIVNGFVGYLHVFVAAPRTLAILGIVSALSALAMWGIAESVWVAAISTLLEIGGLLIIIVACGGSFADLPQRIPEMIPPADTAVWHAIALGAFLAFFAFIGFEDMVNVAEEARNPVRDMPRAILLAAVLATVLYMLVSTVAVLTAAPAELAASEAPLALIYERATGQSAVFISLIGLVAVVNGALIQMIMAARVLYGMSRERWIPSVFGAVHKRTQTPLFATATVSVAVLVIAVLAPLVELAKATSFVILAVFVLVNLSLLSLKVRGVTAPADVWRCPVWAPVAGAVISALLLVLQALSWV